MKTYRVVVSDHFLENESNIFYTDSPSKMTDYLIGRNEQQRIVCIGAQNTTDNINIYACGNSFSYTHLMLLKSLFDEGFIKQGETVRNLYRNFTSYDAEDLLIYSPISLTREESETDIKSLSSDRWSRYIVYEGFIVANKDLFGDLGDALLGAFRMRSKKIFSTPDFNDVVGYLEYGKVPEKHFYFS